MSDRIYVIYKQIFDEEGNIIKIELVECDASEKSAVSFTKLYNLQTPSDIKSRMQFAYMGTYIK